MTIKISNSELLIFINSWLVSDVFNDGALEVAK